MVVENISKCEKFNGTKFVYGVVFIRIPNWNAVAEVESTLSIEGGTRLVICLVPYAPEMLP